MEIWEVSLEEALPRVERMECPERRGSLRRGSKTKPWLSPTSKEQAAEEKPEQETEKQQPGREGRTRRWCNVEANGRALFLLCGQSLAHSGCCWVGEGWMSQGARLEKEQPERCVPSPFQTQASPQGRAFSARAGGQSSLLGPALELPPAPYAPQMEPAEIAR